MNYLGRIAYALVFLTFGQIPNSSDLEKTNNQTAGDPSVGFSVLSDTTTTRQCGINFRIFDFSCTASNQYTIPVNNLFAGQLGQNIVLEEVRLIIDHDWNADLDMSLRSPNGVWVELSSDNGGASNDYGDPTDLSCERYTSFSMSACIPVTQGQGPFLGHFLPEGNLNDFNDGSDPNGDWILQLCDDALGDAGTLKFVELVFTDETFRPVTALQSDAIGPDFIDLTWTTNNPTCTNTIIEYGDPGFLPGTDQSAGEGIVVVLPCPVVLPYRLTGLSEYTEYDLYVREEDNTGNFSRNSCPLSFTSDCTTDPTSLRESFDTQTDCGQDCGNSCELSGVWKNTTGDDFDWLLNRGETSTSDTGPSDDITGDGQYLYVETSRRACRSGNAAILESNCLSIDATSGQCHLSFYTHFFGADINGMHLDISTDNGASWSTIWSLFGETGDRWIKNYVDLSAYDGQVARFRFWGFGGDSRLGDLAIDEIRFYGTTDLGDSPYVFYEDLDGDSFGDPASPVASCEDVLLPGTVRDSTDCNDADPTIFPGATEILCNGIDENCNGMMDDWVLPDPIVSDARACRGDVLTIRSTTAAFGTYYWFATPTDPDPIFTGRDFTVPQTDTSATYYLLDSLPPNCRSERVPVNIAIEPVPELIVNLPEPVCQGTEVDLAALAVADGAQLNGTLTYHNDTPATSANELNSPVVSPAVSTVYYIKKTTPAGCSDEIPLEIQIFPSPQMSLSPDRQIPLCEGTSTFVTAIPAADVAQPVEFRWSNGTREAEVELFGSRGGQSDTYYVTLTDGRGCSRVDSVIVETANSVSSVSVDQIEPVSSCGGTDGAITLSPLDGTGPFDYYWEGPVSGNSQNISSGYRIPDLLQGNYRITIVDQAPPACSFVLPLLVVNGPAVVVDPNIGIQQESCFGAMDGSINLTVFANNPIFTWSNGAQTEDLTGVGAGIYSVTITDSNCSVILEDLEIESPPELTAEVFELTEASCPGNTDGQIDVSIRGGRSPYTFDWSNGETTEDLPSVPAGLYSLTVTDANACTQVLDNIPLLNRPFLFVDLLENQSPDCAGEENGTIRVVADGGTAPYRYNWSNGRQGPILTGIPAGVYTLTVTDAAGCITESTELLADALPLEVTELVVQAPSCNGVADGSIQVEMRGGTEPYTYQWSDGASGPVRNQLEAGTYVLTITDDKGCTISLQPIEIVAPVSLIVEDFFPQGASCFGVNDGFIDLTIRGGTEPYTYNWSHGETVADPMDLPAGFYTVTITDQNGCLLTIPEIEIVQFEPLNATVDLAADPSCGDSDDGLIEISTESLSPPVTYQWSNGDTTEDLRDLPVGAYACTITDAAGCMDFVDTIYLTAPPALQIEIVDTEAPTCFGLPQGVISAQVSGGIRPYTFEWSNGDTTRNLSSVPAGNYRLLVFDARGCARSSDTVTIVEPEELNVEIVDVVPTGCDNLTGAIEVAPVGGTPPYDIIWTTGDTSFAIDQLDPGDYGLTLTDAEGCIRLQSSIEVSITPEEFEVDVATQQDVSCPGENDGSIVPFPLGGQGPYQFNWSNGIQDSINRQLAPGTYEVTITDRNGCTGVASNIEIKTAPDLQYQVQQIQDALCYGEASGIITLNVQGGTAPYVVSWSHGDTGLIVGNLSTGRYSFTITDARGCEVISQQDLEVGEPANVLAIGQLLLDSTTCADQSDGAARLMISGGTEPYRFIWSTGDTANYVQGLVADSTYQCTVTDANGCLLEINDIEVRGPQPLEVVFASEPASRGESDGRAAVLPAGGTPPYTYRWDLGTTYAEDSLVTGLAAGTYAFTLTDANFCTLVDSATVDEKLSSATNQLTLGAKVKIYPNPLIRGQELTIRIDGARPGQLTITLVALKGTILEEQTVANYQSGQDLRIKPAMPAGLYFVKVELAGYRTAVRKVVVVE